MRIFFIIGFCGMLSASICQNIGPNLYDAAVLNKQNIEAFISGLYGKNSASKPDVAEAEKILDSIKSIMSVCTHNHKEPAGAKITEILASVAKNDQLLQKSGPFSEPALEKAREKAIETSNKLMGLLSEFPQSAAVLAKKPAQPDKDDEEEDDASDDEEDDEEDDDDGEDDGEDDEDEDEDDEGDGAE